MINPKRVAEAKARVVEGTARPMDIAVLMVECTEWRMEPPITRAVFKVVIAPGEVKCVFLGDKELEEVFRHLAFAAVAGDAPLRPVS